MCVELDELLFGPSVYFGSALSESGLVVPVHRPLQRPLPALNDRDVLSVPVVNPILGCCLRHEDHVVSLHLLQLIFTLPEACNETGMLTREGGGGGGANGSDLRCFLKCVHRHTNAKPSDEGGSQTGHLVVLRPGDLFAEQVGSQLHDKVIGRNSSVHPEEKRLYCEGINKNIQQTGNG